MRLFQITSSQAGSAQHVFQHTRQAGTAFLVHGNPLSEWQSYIARQTLRAHYSACFSTPSREPVVFLALWKSAFNMKLFTALLALASIAFGATDKWIGCFLGVETAVNYLTFNVTDPTDYYGNLCTTELYTISMYAAAKLYCRPREIQAGYDYFSPLCQEYGGVTLVPYSQIEPLLTDEYMKSLTIAGYNDYEEGTVFNKPVLITRSYWKIARDTTVRVLYAMCLCPGLTRRQVVFDQQVEEIPQAYGSVSLLCLFGCCG